jgi:hypothetical protein
MCPVGRAASQHLGTRVESPPAPPDMLAISDRMMTTILEMGLLLVTRDIVAITTFIVLVIIIVTVITNIIIIFFWFFSTMMLTAVGRFDVG